MAPRLAARQRKLTLGDIVDNDYIVVSGLNPGDRLITGGVQKLRDGAPVNVRAAAPPQAS